MKKTFILLFCAFLFGCIMPSKTSVVNSHVKGMVYNSVMSDYTNMLTTVSLMDFSDGKQALSYRVQTYKLDQFGNREDVYLHIPRESVDEHLSLLNKFIDWDSKAKSRNEQFDKEIGRAKTINGYSVYNFHSGSSRSNFLAICFVLSEKGACMVDDVTFDLPNVKLLIQDLNKFKTGGFKPIDASIYQ